MLNTKNLTTPALPAAVVLHHNQEGEMQPPGRRMAVALCHGGEDHNSGPDDEGYKGVSCKVGGDIFGGGARQRWPGKPRWEESGREERRSEKKKEKSPCLCSWQQQWYVGWRQPEENDVEVVLRHGCGGRGVLLPVVAVDLSRWTESGGESGNRFGLGPGCAPPHGVRRPSYLPR